MKRILMIVCVIAAGGLLSACNAVNDGMVLWGDGVAGSGVMREDVRSFSPLHGVHLATVGDLKVEAGDRDELQIEVDDNLLRYFSTSVEDGILKIELEDGASIRPSSGVRYRLVTSKLDMLRTSSSGDIHAKDVSGTDVDIATSSSGDISVATVEGKHVHLATSSSGDISIHALQAQELRAALSSSGDISIDDGSVEGQEVRVSSSGDYGASNLRSQHVTARVSSSGDVRVWAVDALQASTSSSGSIYFRGNPRVKAQSSSSGDIERLR